MKSALYADHLVDGKRTSRLIARYDEQVTQTDVTKLAQALGASVAGAERTLVNMGIAVRPS